MKENPFNPCVTRGYEVAIGPIHQSIGVAPTPMGTRILRIGRIFSDHRFPDRPSSEWRKRDSGIPAKAFASRIG